MGLLWAWIILQLVNIGLHGRGYISTFWLALIFIVITIVIYIIEVYPYSYFSRDTHEERSS